PTPVEPAVAHGVEQDRLPAVPPDVGGDLHRTVRRMRGTHRTRCLRSILVIYRPQPTAARPAAYRFAVFVGLAFVGLTHHRSPPCPWQGCDGHARSGSRDRARRHTWR